MQQDAKHPKAKAHMLRWAELRFGGAADERQPTEPRELARVMEDYATMVRKYTSFEFDVGERLADGTVLWTGGVSFPNEFRRNDAAIYEDYRRGKSGVVLRVVKLVPR
jgi:hypothetical protein